MVASFLPTVANAESQGFIQVKSSYSVSETANRLISLIKQRNLKLFAQINHAAGAETVGEKLRPTQLIIFGNPKTGTPLMQCSQNVAIDLPMKALVWMDESGQVWIGYNDPAYLQSRHELNDCGKQILEKIGKALENLATDAANPLN